MSDTWQEKLDLQRNEFWTEFQNAADHIILRISLAFRAGAGEFLQKEFFPWVQETLRKSARQTTSERQTGRTQVLRMVVPHWGTLVIRQSVRGGLLSGLLGAWYVRLPRSDYRVFDELNLLRELHEAGLSVPEPAGALIQQGPIPGLYRSMFLTRELPAAENLFVLARGGAELSLLVRSVERAGREAKRLLQRGVFHPDLHLGNILLSQERVVLIDFDKSQKFRPSPELCRYWQERLILRFHRFCEKYGIYPEPLTASFRHGLESVFEVASETNSP